MLADLRELMYRPDIGTWFDMELSIESGGDYIVRFERDRPPENPDNVPEFSDDIYAQDLKVYPRSAGNIPEWLAQKVYRAQSEGMVE